MSAALDPLPLGPDGHGFDLSGFARSIEQGAIKQQVARYSLHAEVRLVDDDHPSRAPLIIHGRAAIEAWLSWADPTAGCRVVDLIATDDRVAFTELRTGNDGTATVIRSVAELEDGLITWQHTIVDQAGPEASTDRLTG